MAAGNAKCFQLGINIIPLFHYESYNHFCGEIWKLTWTLVPQLVKWSIYTDVVVYCWYLGLNDGQLYMEFGHVHIYFS